MKAKSSPWIDQELRESISRGDEAIVKASKSGVDSDIIIHRKSRNLVVKLNSQKKTLCYNTKFEKCRSNSKQIWHTENGLVGRSNSASPIGVEVDFESKANDLRSSMNYDVSTKLLVDKIHSKIMKERNCNVVLPDISVD